VSSAAVAVRIRRGVIQTGRVAASQARKPLATPRVVVAVARHCQGVELTPGERLSTSDEDREIYAIELEPLSGAPAPPEEEGRGHAHAGGSLYVYDDTAAAEEEMNACQAAADLVCYRAANVVVILEGGGIEAQRLGVAIQKLADG